MAFDSEIDCLRLFNEHVDELRLSSFAEFVRTNPLSFKFRATGDDPVEFEQSAPTRESLKAFVLTMRMFLQRKDVISLEKLDALLARVPIDAALRDRFTRSYAKWTSSVDGDALFVFGDAPINGRRLLEVFLYGALAHLDGDKRRQFEQWRASPMFGLMETHFHFIIRETYTFLRWTQHFNREVISALETL